jgi:hypothetical protein
VSLPHPHSCDSLIPLTPHKDTSHLHVNKTPKPCDSHTLLLHSEKSASQTSQFSLSPMWTTTTYLQILQSLITWEFVNFFPINTLAYTVNQKYLTCKHQKTWIKTEPSLHFLSKAPLWTKQQQPQFHPSPYQWLCMQFTHRTEPTLFHHINTSYKYLRSSA